MYVWSSLSADCGHTWKICEWWVVRVRPNMKPGGPTIIKNNQSLHPFLYVAMVVPHTSLLSCVLLSLKTRYTSGRWWWSLFGLETSQHRALSGALATGRFPGAIDMWEEMSDILLTRTYPTDNIKWWNDAWGRVFAVKQQKDDEEHSRYFDTILLYVWSLNFNSLLVYTI